MRFNFSFGTTDSDKWEKFNSFLEELSNQYPQEFQKDIYTEKRFITIGYKTSPPDIIYNINPEVPANISSLIEQQLLLLFP
ncbi:hypothetical protein [Ferruginibacter albus]|uniref:hypothetical protein n=1 Tax=Ferruginibacter albus TaxID=2875540 RepID=UPI001CC3C344|nr:hypothetical protein [Ferruginibacter albus]UAY53430.1 hypothetical protein K9M53_07090 [Ferruginibacter albus]